MGQPTWQLDDLRVFLSVSHHGSFSAAARAMSMPRSTVSRRVAAFEDELGCRLLHRTTRSVRLTTEGQRLADGCRPLLRDLESLVEDVVTTGGAPSGCVRAAAPVGLGRDLISAFLADLRTALPDIRLEVIATSSSDEVDLIGDELDLAVVEGPLRDTSWRRILLFRSQAICVASPAYLENRGTPAAPEELLVHDTLHRLHGSRDPQWGLADGGAQPVRPLIATTDIGVLQQAACDGHGIAFLSRLIVRDALSSGELVQVVPEVAEPREYYAVFAHADPPLRVRAVLDFTSDYILSVFGEG